MTSDSAARAAALLLQARRAGRQLDALPADCAPTDLAAAYAIQDAGVAGVLETAGGGRQVGWKCGATNQTAMANFRLAEPFRGRLLSPFVHDSPATIPMTACLTPALESEFAFRLGRDLPAAAAPYDEAAVLAAVAAVLPAIEVIDFRLEEAPKQGGLAVIADSGGAGHWVAGAALTDWSAVDFAGTEVTLSVNGEVVQRGSSAAVLGNPLTSLAWLANDLAKRGQGLKAGEVVTTGTCTAIVPARRGDEVVARFGPLGQAEVRFV